MTEYSALIKDALAVAKKYPVFPTNNKKPVWSNLELDVGKGQGGYKIATQDPDRVVKLFSHPRATEIAVPMGEMSGLICVDVDSYKDTDGEMVKWMSDNDELLSGTLRHTTRSGGLHILFEHPGDVGRLPATLRAGVDLKANGTGYVCWPPTEGYTRMGRTRKIRAFPMELVTNALKEKGGTGSLGGGNSFNEASDADLMDRIRGATELYPSLRSLSYRLASRRINGKAYTEDQIVEILTGVMTESEAAAPRHPRHEDWLDRGSKIADLAGSAIRSNELPTISEAEAELWTEGPSFIDTQRMIARGVRPIGPQRETTASDIEDRVAEMMTEESNLQINQSDPSKSKEADEITSSAYVRLNGKVLKESTFPPLQWLIPNMIPVQSICSLAGASNVGKTRWICMLLACMSIGDTAKMGLPQATKAVPSLFVANEERGLDVARRLKAAMLHHEVGDTEDIIVRGKDAGALRLVAIDEASNPKLDENNIAELVKEANESGAKLIVIDPYVTLSDAMDENSAQSAAMLTKAFLLITQLTGAAVLHAHHTPKERSKDLDWIRGSSDGWRGSGAIYSGLDCGFTLANWMPLATKQRNSWKGSRQRLNLSRWIVLDTGKIREGAPLEPVIYELVGQSMQEGEGDPIGVCQLSSEDKAAAVLTNDFVDLINRENLPDHIFDEMGVGGHTNNQVHQAMRKAGHAKTGMWPCNVARQMSETSRQEIYAIFRGDGRTTTDGLAQLTLTKSGSGKATKWLWDIKETS